MHGRRNPMPRRDPSFRDERLGDRLGKLSGTVYCPILEPVSYTHLRAHETDSHLVFRLLLAKKKKTDIAVPPLLVPTKPTL